jgi:hypothetical protein
LKINLKCVAAVLIPSPKAEDVVFKYCFTSGQSPQGKDGDAWQDGQIQVWSKESGAFVVGKDYSLEVKIS